MEYDRHCSNNSHFRHVTCDPFMAGLRLQSGSKFDGGDAFLSLFTRSLGLTPPCKSVSLNVSQQGLSGGACPPDLPLSFTSIQLQWPIFLVFTNISHLGLTLFRCLFLISAFFVFVVVFFVVVAFSVGEDCKSSKQFLNTWDLHGALTVPLQHPLCS